LDKEKNDSWGCDAGLEMMARRFEDCRRVYRLFMKLPYPSNCLSIPFWLSVIPTGASCRKHSF